jgi:hypothetical protein
MTIHPVGIELFHAAERTDGRTDGLTERYDEADSFFSQFCQRDKRLDITLHRT